MERVFQGKGSILLIIIISIVVPGLVAMLFLVTEKLELGTFVYKLPHLHAVINSLTSFVLISAFVTIRIGLVNWHKGLMTSAVVMGVLFLISYVTYHSSVESVVFGDLDGNGALDTYEEKLADTRGTYLILLLSHILLSLVALPLVLLSLYHALKSNFEAHKRLVKFSFPVWLYVSVSGVLVYWMMRPYYF
ncbi:MAG: DUF420 domain-containing protein [Cytophagales bacterium]|nr:DUF420 domain-containing protein [Cytophagales bacterium]